MVETLYESIRANILLLFATSTTSLSVHNSFWFCLSSTDKFSSSLAVLSDRTRNPRSYYIKHVVGISHYSTENKQKHLRTHWPSTWQNPVGAVNNYLKNGKSAHDENGQAAQCACSAAICNELTSITSSLFCIPPFSSIQIAKRQHAQMSSKQTANKVKQNARVKVFGLLAARTEPVSTGPRFHLRPFGVYVPPCSIQFHFWRQGHSTPSNKLWNICPGPKFIQSHLSSEREIASQEKTKFMHHIIGNDGPLATFSAVYLPFTRQNWVYSNRIGHDAWNLSCKL